MTPMIHKSFIALSAALLLSVAAWAQRYCNPLPMPVGEDGVAAGEVYDPSGRKISKLQRGVNIVNGKKVMVK